MNVNAVALGARRARSRSTLEGEDSMTGIALPFVFDWCLKAFRQGGPHGLAADDAVMARAPLDVLQLRGDSARDEDGVVERDEIVCRVMQDAQLNRVRKTQ